MMIAFILLTGLACSNGATSGSASSADIAKIAADLIRADENAAKSGQVEVNFQGHTSSRAKDDKASGSFFKSVHNDLVNAPTVKALFALYDNYERDTGIAEDNTASESKEVNAFLDKVMDTGVMEKLETFLKAKGYNEGDDLRSTIKSLWFDNYSRAKGRMDTSGFEHIFIGEYKRGVSGLHSWHRLYKLEQQRQLDYKGFIIKRTKSNRRDPLFALIRYQWDSEQKSAGSIFIGTSPEFELAIYTLCFVTRANRECRFEYDGTRMEIVTHDIVQNGKRFIGSAYPSLPR